MKTSARQRTWFIAMLVAGLVYVVAELAYATVYDYDVPYLNQLDYAGSPHYIGNSACGPTSVAMLLCYYFPNSDIDVPEVYHAGIQGYQYWGPAVGYKNVSFQSPDPGLSIVDLAYRGYYTHPGFDGYYSGLRSRDSAAQYLDFFWGGNSDAYRPEWAGVIAEIQERPFIMNIANYLTTGHYIVVRGYDDKGTDSIYDDSFYVNDPYPWAGEPSGDNRELSYYQLSTWYKGGVVTFDPTLTEEQRQYTVLVDSESVVLDDIDDDEWREYYGAYGGGGDWYYPEATGHWAKWQPDLPVGGRYEVHVILHKDSSQTDVTYAVCDHTGTELEAVTVNQLGSGWIDVSLGTYSLSDGAYVMVASVPVLCNVDAVRFEYIEGESLFVSLQASPSSGTAPLSGVDLTATVSGSAVGTINYTFYCDRSDSGVNITPGWADKIDDTTINPYTAYNVCDYSTPGTYTAKVIAERGSLQVEDRVSIVVAAAPDTTDPSEVSNLHSTSHSPSTWSKDNTIDVAWTAATDAQSGVDGYSILWDHSSSTVPDTSKDIEEVTSTTSSPLANGTWYFHIRTVDNAGNWDNTAADLGPFYIDTSRPTCSLSINNGDSSTNSLTVTLNLNGSDTGGSGLYQMHFSNNGSTWSTWETYNSTKSNWDLSSNGGNTNTGTKTTYCQVNDHAGNVVAAPCSDTINYSPACTYNISPSTRAFNYSGGSDTVTVTTQSGCSWTATSNKSWIHVTSGGSGTGNGTVYYSVDGNSNTSSRSGTMTIAGKTFTVNQDGAAWITITVPNGGEIGKIGDTEPIMWDAHNAGNNVELEYSTNAGSSWKNIINSTANDGEYSWTIPNDPSTQCRVKVISISYPSVFDISNDNFTIWLDTAAVFRVESTGDVLADGSFYGQKFLAGSADVAEWVPVSEPVEPGDVLELDPDNQGQYRKTSSRCSTLVAGVVSTEPGVVLGTGKDVEGKALLALLGIVPVKVTDEGGPIHPGDLLVTSSTPGYAMRWDPGDGSPCDLVGKALEPLTEESGIILVLLTAH